MFVTCFHQPAGGGGDAGQPRAPAAGVRSAWRVVVWLRAGRGWRGARAIPVQRRAGHGRGRPGVLRRAAAARIWPVAMPFVERFCRQYRHHAVFNFG